MGMGNPSSPCEGDGATTSVDEEGGMTSDPCEDDDMPWLKESS